MFAVEISVALWALWSGKKQEHSWYALCRLVGSNFEEPQTMMYLVTRFEYNSSETTRKERGRRSNKGRCYQFARAAFVSGTLSISCSYSTSTRGPPVKTQVRETNYKKQKRLTHSLPSSLVVCGAQILVVVEVPSVFQVWISSLKKLLISILPRRSLLPQHLNLQ